MKKWAGNYISWEDNVIPDSINKLGFIFQDISKICPKQEDDRPKNKKQVNAFTFTQ